MTITTTTNRISYSGDGVTTDFAAPFLFFDEDHLLVILVDASGVETTLVITTHYTVADVGDPAGGTVTMVTPPASGETLVIVRNQPYTQTLDLVENDPFPSDAVENTLDKNVIMCQQLLDQIGRSFTLSDGDTSGASLTIPSPVADSVIGVWNATADTIVIGPTVGEISNAEGYAADAAADAAAAAADAAAAAASAADAADAAASINLPTPTVADSFLQANASGTGYEALTAAQARTALDLVKGTATGNVVVLENVGGSPGLPAVDGSQLTGIPFANTLIYNVEDFGASTGASASTNTAAIQAAIDAAEATAYGVILFPAFYTVDAGLVCTGNDIIFQGLTRGAGINCTTVSVDNLLELQGCSRVTMRDMLLNWPVVPSTGGSPAVLYLNNAVQCYFDRCRIQGGRHNMNIYNGSTDNTFINCTFTYPFVHGVDVNGSGASVNGAHHFIRCTFNQPWPAGSPTPAGSAFKGTLANSTAYATGNVVTYGGVYYQCTVGGTTASSLPGGFGAGWYGDNFVHGTATFQIARVVGSYGIRFDTNTYYNVVRQCDITAPVVAGIAMENNAAGDVPEEITVERCTIHGPISQGVAANAGKLIHVMGLNTWTPVGNTGTNRAGVYTAATDVNITHCSMYSFDFGILVAGSRNNINTNLISGCATAGIQIGTGASSHTITNNQAGSGPAGANAIGIAVAAGGSDHYVIANNVVAGASVGVSDSGTGVNKSITANV